MTDPLSLSLHVRIIIYLPTGDSRPAEWGMSGTYSQTVGKERPTKALDKYSVYISLATPSR